MGLGKNHHRTVNSVRSALRRKRRSAAKAASLARWKKPAVSGARVVDLQCLSIAFEEFLNTVHNVKGNVR